MSSKYYYLVAGLPELSLEDSKLSYTVADFKTEIYDGLSASDQKLIDLFYLKFERKSTNGETTLLTNSLNIFLF